MNFTITTTYRKPRDADEAAMQLHRRQRAIELLAELVHQQLRQDPGSSSAPAAVSVETAPPSEPLSLPERLPERLPVFPSVQIPAA